MPSYNRIIMAGHLTRNPELTHTAAQVGICKFGLATNHKWKSKDGVAKEDVCFVDCTIFGKAGETFSQYMAKGRLVLIEGRLHLNQWTTSDGQKRSKHEIHVENFTFLGGKDDAKPKASEGRFDPPSPEDKDIPF